MLFSWILHGCFYLLHLRFLILRDSLIGLLFIVLLLRFYSLKSLFAALINWTQRLNLQTGSNWINFMTPIYLTTESFSATTNCNHNCYYESYSEKKYLNFTHIYCKLCWTERLFMSIGYNLYVFRQIPHFCEKYIKSCTIWFLYWNCT